jgi:hypothetical protein
MSNRFLYRMWVHFIAICLSSVIPVRPLIGQMRTTNQGIHQNSQDPEALKVVDHAIEVMGGKAAWSQSGAAVAEAAISLGAFPSERIEWEDDWSSGHPKFRRSSADRPKGSAIVGNEHQRMVRSADGRTRSIPAESNLAALALGYPAPALAIGLQRPNCRFSSPTVTGPGGDTSISEECAGSASSGPPVLLQWEFSRTTGLPTKLRRPVRDMLTGRRLWETVLYVAFQTIDGLSVPTELIVIKPNGTKEPIRVSETKFSNALPEATFNVQDGESKNE